ncbi:MAG: ABC transporter ATP-binding protein [Dermatophilaceae bacterium]
MRGQEGSGPVVELVGVHKSYGPVEALRGVDLRIESGECVVILGPNGAGKTTAVSLILGLRGPTSGQVRLLGLAPTDRAARSCRGAMLQDSGVPGLLTVRELIELFRSYYPYPLSVAETLRLAGLEKQAQVHASRLSGGQRQRLYFALAVCGDPAVLFLDEPTVSMDVAARRSFLETIARYGAQGKTVVLTTHFMEEADEVARRIVVIDRGRVIADGTPAEIKAMAAGKRVRFRAADELDPGTFDGLAVTGLALVDHSVRFLSNEPELVLAELFRRGTRITDLEVGGADLEEAFLALTSREEALA